MLFYAGEIGCFFMFRQEMSKRWMGAFRVNSAEGLIGAIGRWNKPYGFFILLADSVGKSVGI
ncbi:hypothetical protein [Microbulbifer variabilis]|uniref:hypothetical protein n=1 Tax=Microbulbifer variabilis TaxID=266805 RepID=UPI001CFF09BE|nr:hypothetical protein [Microbulbifer variabilis]